MSKRFNKRIIVHIKLVFISRAHNNGLEILIFEWNFACHS